MLVIEILLGVVALWSLLTVIRTGIQRCSGDDWNSDETAKFMVQSAQSLILSLGFLGVLLK